MGEQFEQAMVPCQPLACWAWVVRSSCIAPESSSGPESKCCANCLLVGPLRGTFPTRENFIDVGVPWGPKNGGSTKTLAPSRRLAFHQSAGRESIGLTMQA